METTVMRTFDNYFSANIILTRMQAAGINCYLKDENTVTIDPLLTAAIGGIKLAVDINQEVAARHLLEEFHQEEIKEAICPVCKQKAIKEMYKPMKNVLTGILNKLFSKYTIPIEMWYECTNCGWKERTLVDTKPLENFEIV